MITQTVHGIRFSLKEPHSFDWLEESGRVFCVFDQLISGNICFGINTPKGKMFIKYAGAKTSMYPGDPAIAINNLQSSEKIYSVLRHPCFPELMYHIETNNGFGLAMRWFEGYSLAPLSFHMERFRSLPLLQRLLLYDRLMDSFVFSVSRDYLPAGVSDHHIVVNVDQPSILFSSVGSFLQFPANTPYPKLSGSPWYVPPEGYHVGAELDEYSAVYTMGTLAFTFFGQRNNPSAKFWEAGPQLLSVTNQAVSPAPSHRQQSCRQYLDEWRKEVLKLNL